MFGEIQNGKSKASSGNGDSAIIDSTWHFCNGICMRCNVATHLMSDLLKNLIRITVMKSEL